MHDHNQERPSREGHFPAAMMSRRPRDSLIDSTTVNRLSIRPLTELAAAIVERRRNDDVLLVGIDGRGGSGKSTLARSLARLVESSLVIEFDDFYRPAATRLGSGDPDIGGNFEWRRLRDQVLIPLSQNNEARYQRYDWHTDSMAGGTPSFLKVSSSLRATTPLAMSCATPTIFVSGCRPPMRCVSHVASNEAERTPATAGLTNTCQKKSAISRHRSLGAPPT